PLASTGPPCPNGLCPGRRQSCSNLCPLAGGLGGAQSALSRLELDERARIRSAPGSVHLDSCAVGWESRGLGRQSKIGAAHPGNSPVTCLVYLALQIIRLLGE